MEDKPFCEAYDEVLCEQVCEDYADVFTAHNGGSCDRGIDGFCNNIPEV